MLPIRLKPAPPNVPTAQLSQLVGYMCVGDRLKLRPWVGVDAANAHRPPVREPERRVSMAQQGSTGGLHTTGEGPKPCGSGPSYCCTNAARSPRFTPTLRAST